jgi:uncharacterized protein YbjT (DUF2867 family)
MSRLILVTGATGYVATRLIPALLAKGYKVRCLARSPEKLRNRPWVREVEIVQGDVLETESLRNAMAGVDAAYYLIHNMSSGESYREKESLGARNFGEAARIAGLRKIIYLGGLGGSGEFRHMRSRQEAGRILRQSGVSVVELRASVVIGSGSISFEMIRYLTSWFPFIPAPEKTNHPGQPIGIRDLLNYLLTALERENQSGEILEIGGPEVLLYPDLMVEFARQKRLIRAKLFLPFYSVSLSARIADWLTPVPYVISKPLMEELTAPSAISNPSAVDELLNIDDLSTYPESVKYALSREEYQVGFPWTGSLVTRRPLIGGSVKTCGEGFLIDHREVVIKGASSILVEFLQGKLENDWDVEEIKAGEWIRLRQARNLFGEVRVELQLQGSLLMQTVLFEPGGLAGLLWWNMLYPYNAYRFMRMLGKLL